jgi:hypothetical protein
MKRRRSSTHREFSVRSAGWFTVLKPDAWFPALRLPGRFRDRSSHSVETTLVDHADIRQTTTSPQIMIPSTKDRRLMRPALIFLTAMMVTSGLLWWIMHP